MQRSIFDLHSDPQALTPTETILLQFMESTIKKINSCMVNIRAMQEILVEKGVVTQAQLDAKIRLVENYPDMAVGREVLMEMLKQAEVPAQQENPKQ